MIIYELCENRQTSDADSYYHYYMSETINLYSTKDLALKAMDTLLEDLEYSGNMAWDAKLGDGRNIIEIQQGSHTLETIKVNKYFISELTVIDK